MDFTTRNASCQPLDHDHAELLLYTDALIGEWATGDVEQRSAKQWPLWCDDWYYTTAPDESEAEIVASTSREDDLAIESETMSDLDYARWLSSIEASEADFEAMERYFERNSWDYGHREEL